MDEERDEPFPMCDASKKKKKKGKHEPGVMNNYVNLLPKLRRLKEIVHLIHVIFSCCCSFCMLHYVPC